MNARGPKGVRPMSRQKRFVAAIASVLFALVAGACASTERSLPSAAELDTRADASKGEYLIGAGDVLAITVWRQPELSLPEVVVRSDGRISVPLVDEVDVLDKTPLELKHELTERLEEYVTAPHVTVVVRQINSKLVYVLGEVKREGPVLLHRDMRVIDALSTAGGFTPFAGKSRIKLIRDQNGSGPAEFVFDYDDFVRGENLEQNVLLLPGDRIVVPDDTPRWR